MYSAFVKYVYYPFTQLLKRERVKEYLGEMECSQWLPQEELERRQLKKLRGLLRYIAREVPYYREMFGEMGADPEEIKTGADLARLPVLTKDVIRERSDDLLDASYEGRVFTGKTSGSTGMALHLFSTPEYDSWDWASRWRARRWFSVDVGDREAAIWGRPVYSSLERYLGPIKARLRNVLLLSGFHLSEEVLHAYWKKIRAFRPSYIYGYASSIFELAQYVRETGEEAGEVGIKAVFSTAETLYEPQRELIESVFGCTVSNEYGCSETGAFAYECPYGNMHISSENVIVEFVPGEYGSSVPGAGEITVTLLTNSYMPFVRYRIGDLGAPVDTACACGRTLPLMKLVATKVTDTVVNRQGRRFSSEIFDYINLGLVDKGIRGIKQFRVIQKRPEHFEVQVVKDTQFSEAPVRFFREKMVEFLGEEIVVDFVYVEHLSRDRTGKLRYFVSEIPETAR